MNYIKNQEEHHRKTKVKDEFLKLLNENADEFDSNYVFDNPAEIE